MRKACPIAVTIAVLAAGALVAAHRSEPGSVDDPPRYDSWSPPVNLGAPVNTNNLDGCPFISRDGLALFFASNRHLFGAGPTDLYVSERADRDAPWGDPVSLGTDINMASGEELCPTLTISQRYLFLVSNRAGGCGGNDIYVARREDKKSFTSWGTPENVGCHVNSPQSDITPSLFEDEDGTTYLYFSSNRPGGVGLADIYISTLQPDGSFGSPVLAPGLNTTFIDQRPNLRVRDGLEIYFESNRPGALGGSLDLWVATRPDTASGWSTPEHLPDPVNSTAVDGRPSLSFDGTELYFMSNRSPGGLGEQDVYVATRSKLTGKP